MRWAILDTSVYVGHWEGGLYDGEIPELRKRFVIRHSAIVLSELRRGARTLAAQRLVSGLRRLARTTWAPLGEDWWEAGLLIRTIGDAHHWDPVRRRAFQNDALIALTARRNGAVVVTANRADFELLSERTGVRILVLKSSR